MQKRSLLGQILVDCGLLTPAQLEQALAEQCRERTPRISDFGFRISESRVQSPESGQSAIGNRQSAMGEQTPYRSGRLGEILLERGFLTEDQLQWALSTQLDIPYVRLRPDFVDREAAQSLPRSLLERHVALPIMREGDCLTVAMADPTDGEALKEIADFSGCQIVPVFGLTQNVLETQQAIFRSLSPPTVPLPFPGSGGAGDKAIGKLGNWETGKLGNQPQPLEPNFLISQFPSATLGTSEGVGAGGPQVTPHTSRITPVSPEDSPLLTCLEQAVAEQSTEVHFEPTTAGAVRVRYRVGGQLREGSAVDLTLDQAMRDLKALAHLDLQDRVLQQGGFPRTLAGQSYEFTVALLPTVRGETAIVRVLPHHRPVDLLALGFDEPAQVRLKGVMQHPAGVLLLAGPADSGQMATAYALLDVVDAHRCKVVTVERRVRYAVDLFTQIEWLPQDFPLDRAFMSAAYQSADVLLVDGVEHLSNVPQVFEAAQQGALVMGTLALPDFQAVGEWLVQNQIKPQTLRQLLVAVVVLRLRGRPCPACHLTPQKEHGVGCEQCQFTGWIERRLNYETLFFDEDEARQQLEAVLADW